METVLIADDEYNIREGLKLIIDWQALGFEICGEAANGEEALHSILTLNPSLTLLDIRMPKMHGTDIIRIAREKGYKETILILSGYADFTYAQSAIKYGAANYLTKPIDEDELLESVLKIKNELAEKRLQSNKLSLLKSKAKDVILHELISGTYNTTTFTLKNTELKEMNLLAETWQVVIYEKFGSGSNDANYSFAELLNITNRGNRTFENFRDDSHEIILLKGNFALSRFQRFLDCYEQRPPQPGSPLDSLFLAYGHPVERLEDICLSYQEAAALCRRRFFCTQGQHTLGYKELPDVQSLNLEISSEKLDDFSRRLTGYLLSFNRNKIAETLSLLEEYLYSVKNSIAEVRLFLTDLYFRIKEAVSLTYSTIKIPFPTNADIIDYIESCHYLYEIIQFISEQTQLIVQTTGSSNRDTVLDDVLYYIEHNYRKNIKLEGIAPLFGYSSSYLGKIFNKSVGENFITYLDRKRIEQAKILLQANHLKVYEIAEYVGYNNVDYFHKKFKKFVAMSPAEYRKSVLSQLPEQ